MVTPTLGTEFLGKMALFVTQGFFFFATGDRVSKVRGMPTRASHWHKGHGQTICLNMLGENYIHTHTHAHIIILNKKNLHRIQTDFIKLAFTFKRDNLQLLFRHLMFITLGLVRVLNFNIL